MWHTDCFLINALPIEEHFIFYFKHHETKKKKLSFIWWENEHYI